MTDVRPGSWGGAPGRSLSQLLRPGDLCSTLGQIAEAAVRLIPGADCASTTLCRDGRLETVRATDARARELDELQYSLGEGPYHLATTHDGLVVATDVGSDARFGRFGAAAVERGIHAAASLLLFQTRGSRVSLNLYSRQARAFADIGIDTERFHDEAANAVACAREITGLNEALNTRTHIGAAIGIVMERYGLSEDQALAYLTRLSQNNNVKLRDVAERFVVGRDAPDTGDRTDPETGG